MNNVDKEISRQTDIELDNLLSNTDIIKIKNTDKIIKIIPKDILVFSGGAIKGIAFIGVLKALEIKGILKQIKIYAATSVGTIIMMMCLLGYSPDNMFDIIKSFDLEKIKNLSFGNLLSSYGLDNGNKIEYVIKRLIVAKNYKENINLKEFFDSTNKEFILVTTCLNTMEACYISYKTHPNLELYKAVRMSTCVPILYTPIKLGKYLYIDGGCIDNYPIHMFKDRISRVIGACLMETYECTQDIENLETCIISIISCLMKGVNYQSIKGYEENTIQIDVKAVNIIKYGLSLKEKKTMFNIGFNKTLSFLKNYL
jgi:NTE family protein